jgi:hypothetical protein
MLPGEDRKATRTLSDAEYVECFNHFMASLEPETELKQIERALTILLESIDEHDAKKSKREISVKSLAELMQQPKSALLTSDPIGQSYRLGVRTLGEHLCRLGGTAAMADTLFRVCGENERWNNVLNKRWDGIGRWAA